MLPFQMVFQINKESRVKIRWESAVHVLNFTIDIDMIDCRVPSRVIS